MADVTIVGGGLAGCEAAWQAAIRGIKVDLYEMRPLTMTGAHTTDQLAELVCSNSLGSNLPDRAAGLLKEELRSLHSLLLDCAEKSSVPAGGALAVDREIFSQRVTDQISHHPNIQVIRKEVTEIPSGPAIICSGPLTSPALSQAIRTLTGEDQLSFYDAIAPIVTRESIDMEIAYQGSRYGLSEDPEGDYINCPFTQQQYDRFVSELRQAERIQLKDFEDELNSGVKAGLHRFFEGCLPVEVIAQRGEKSLAFGPMRPIGLTNPRTNQKAYAVVQLRRDNLAGSLYNLVGFQTNLTFSEQKRVFRLIPGLENAEFIRYGQMHRNTFIASPNLLEPSLRFRYRQNLFFAGQITGVEGYMGNVATGLLAGWNLARLMHGLSLVELPKTTMLGSLCYYVTHAPLVDFQPMKANYGILPELGSPKRLSKQEKANLYHKRSLQDLKECIEPLSEGI